MGRKMVIGTALVAALGLAACGGEAGGGGNGGGDAGGATSLSMVDSAFEPATLVASAGAQVDVSNDGELPHNITVEGTDIDEDVEAGASTTVALDLEPGSYTMYCEFHRSQGMEGTLEVQ